MTDNKVVYKCSNCSKLYKGKAPFKKHELSCKSKESDIASNISVPGPGPVPSTNSSFGNTASKSSNPPNQKENANNYDINMTFGEGNKVHVDMKKQPATKQSSARAAGVRAKVEDETDSDEESGEKVLKELIRPKVSETYQEEIDKLENLIKMFKHLPISDDPAKKDNVIDQLKATITILMTQAQSLIKEMKQMSRRNSYYKNNIMLATFILDKCRMDAPETEEEFENMFGETEA
jgi:hypothetical protein